MLAVDFTRYDCLVGKKRRTYETLEREWCCAKCDGRLNVSWSDDEAQHPDHWYIRCGKCGAADFIHQAQAERDGQKVREMFANLPREIVQSYLERREKCQS